MSAEVDERDEDCVMWAGEQVHGPQRDHRTGLVS